MIEQASERRFPVLLAAAVSSLIGGVGTEQVVHAVTAIPGGLDQVGPGKPVQQPASLPKRGVSERGGGVGVKVGAWVQPEQPESSRGLAIQMPDRPREHGPDRREPVPGSVEQIQPLLLAGQLRRDVRQRDAR